MLHNSFCTVDPEIATLAELLKFCTAFEELPPMGLNEGIKIDYLYDGLLPTSVTCFNQINLPNHGTKEDFYKMMDRGIKYSNGHYGLH